MKCSSLRFLPILLVSFSVWAQGNQSFESDQKACVALARAGRPVDSAEFVRPPFNTFASPTAGPQITVNGPFCRVAGTIKPTTDSDIHFELWLPPQADWNSKFQGVGQTSHSTDVVRAYVNSFRRAGLRVGLYYSILSLRDDIRHFNITPAKVELIKNQLTELLTAYGEVDILVTDGWDAPWSRITYEEVPFQEIYGHIKNLQPNCLFCDLNASQYPSGGLYYSDVKAFEQNAGQKVPEDSDVPVTLTDGWFWKQRDANGHLNAVTTVVDEWLEPLNRRHCNLILNAPPTREGRLAPNAVSRLEEIGKAWKHPGPTAKLSEHIVITTRNLATGKPIHASSYPDTVGPDEANDGDLRSSWYLDEGQTSGWLEVDLRKQESFNVVSLVEPVGRWDDYATSRIRRFRFQHWNGTTWITLTGGETPAPTTILRTPRVSAQRVRLLLESSKEMPHIAEIGVYDEPS